MNDFRRETIQIASTEVSLHSHRVGHRWAAKVETADVGNVIGRAMADTREEAEKAAIESATAVLELRNASAMLRASADKLRKR